jgi:TPR repeat protein
VAAESGSAEAALAMGTGHYLGRGLPKDPVRAAHWFREAAKGGDVGAMYLLASMYEQGDGVERDLRLARYWYFVAAQNGDEAAPGKVKELDARPAEPPATTRL